MEDTNDDDNDFEEPQQKILLEDDDEEMTAHMGKAQGGKTNGRKAPKNGKASACHKQRQQNVNKSRGKISKNSN